MKETLIPLSIAITLGATAGLYFLSAIQELWFSAISGIVVCISVFGVLSYSELLFPRSFSDRTPWHLVLSVLLVGVMFTPEASRAIETPFLYATMVFLSGVLLSRATIGVALGRHSHVIADE